MAEKIIITEIDINMNAAIEDARILSERIKELKEESKRLKETEGETSAAFIQNSAELKNVQAQYRTQENLIKNVTTANKSNVGSIEQLRAELSVVSTQWSKLSKEERLNSEEGKKLAARKKELSDTIREERVATGDATANVGRYGDKVGQATGVIGKLIPGLSQATAGAKAFGFTLNLALLPITLIIGAIASLIAYFKRSEEGQDKFNKVMKIFGVILGNIMDVVGKVGEAIWKAVSKPREAWEGFKNLLDRIGNWFSNTLGKVIVGQFQIFTNNIEKGFQKIGLAWQKFKNIFTDNSKKIEEQRAKIEQTEKDIEAARQKRNEGLKNTGESIKKVYESVKKKIGEFIDETKREIEIAKRLADLQASLDRRIRENIVLEAQERLKLAKIKNEIDDKDKNSAKRRLELIDEENKLLDDKQKRELGILKTKLYIKQEENKLSESNKDALNEEAQLRADVFNKEAEIESQRKEAIAKRIEVQRQIAQDEVNYLNYQLELYKTQNKKLLQDFEELQIKELDILNQQLKGKLITQEQYNLAVLKLENETQENIRKQELDRNKTNYDNQLVLVENTIFQKLELEKTGLDLKYQQEIEAAERIGADITLIDKKYSLARKEIANAEKDAKLSLAGEFAQNLATIFGEQTAIGKAAAVASTTIETYKAAQSAYAAMAGIPVVGPILGIAAAGAAVATGIANVKKILAVKSGLPGEKDVSGSSSINQSGQTSSAQIIRTNINPEIGKGIITRNTETVGTQSTKIELQPTLVMDEVQAKQNTNNSQQKTAIL